MRVKTRLSEGHRPYGYSDIDWAWDIHTGKPTAGYTMYVYEVLLALR